MREILLFWQKKDGASAIEYGLMVGLIALAISISVNQMGIKLSGVFPTVAQAIAGPTGNGNASPINPNSGANNPTKAQKQADKKANKKNNGG